MTDIINVINKLENLLTLKPASAEEVKNAELSLGLSLSEEYKEYLFEFGAVLAEDIELTGIAKSNNRNVVFVTKREWEANGRIKHDLYVVENVGIEGIVIWQDSSGKVYFSSPNRGAEKIADSLAEYIESKVNNY